MDGVGISIIGRPRPLPGHDTPNPAHNTYTLKCEEPAKDKFFAEIDGPLDDRYVGLLTDGSNGTYGYSGVEPSEETKRAACQALAEFIY